MRLASMMSLCSVACLVACSSVDETATQGGSAALTADATATSSLYARWTGNLVETEDEGGDAFPGRVRSFALEVDPAHPEAGGQYTVYNRDDQRDHGTFTWSGHVTSSRAAVVLTPDPWLGTWVRTVSLHSVSRPEAVGARGLDFAADPTGEEMDVVLEPVTPGICHADYCAAGHEHCVETDFAPTDPPLSHLCVADGRQIIAYSEP